MIRKMAVSLSIVLLFAAFSGIAKAAEEPSFQILLSTEGDEITATISATNLTDLYGFELILAYDPLRTEFKRAKSGFAGFAVPSIVNGSQLLVAHTKVGPVEGFNGDRELVKLYFDRIRGGTAELSLLEASLVDSQIGLVKYNPYVSASLPGSSPAVKLSDIAGHWAEANLQLAVDLGFVSGYMEGAFQPNKAVTRAEFTAMLVRAIRLPAGPTPDFGDAATFPQWSIPYIASAVQAGIVNGFDDGSFRANHPISRAQMAAIIVRAANLAIENDETPSFTDTEVIPEWARPYIAAAFKGGLVNGKGNNRFMPDDTATRAESVTIILNMLRSRI